MFSGQSQYPFFTLGQNIIFEFDDLYAEQTDYYYRVTAYDYDWTVSALKPIEYIKGMSNSRIKTYSNSYNTLQNYTHYILKIPNNDYAITKSGNYLLEIYEKDGTVVIKRKFIIYQDITTVGVQIKSSRDLKYADQKQNVEITLGLNHGDFQNPMANIHIAVMQNGRWDTYQGDISPDYVLGQDLIYKYNNKLSFWGNNQFLNFDNSDIRQVNNMIGQTTITNGIYNTFLFENYSRRYKGYTYFPDLNGQFYPRNANGYDPATQGEYTWVYFSYVPPNDMPQDTQYYIGGMFNDYSLSDEAKMEYNGEKNNFGKAILVKQGFTNFTYTAVIDHKTSPSENPDGNYALTTNTYQVIVYYKAPIDLYYKAVGFGFGNAKDITN